MKKKQTPANQPACSSTASIDHRQRLDADACLKRRSAKTFDFWGINAVFYEISYTQLLAHVCAEVFAVRVHILEAIEGSKGDPSICESLLIASAYADDPIWAGPRITSLCGISAHEAGTCTPTDLLFYVLTPFWFLREEVFNGSAAAPARDRLQIIELIAIAEQFFYDQGSDTGLSEQNDFTLNPSLWQKRLADARRRYLTEAISAILPANGNTASQPTRTWRPSHIATAERV